MKKVYLFLYYLIFIAIIIALIWAININKNRPMKPILDKNKTIKTSHQKKPIPTKPKKPIKKNKPITKEQKELQKALKEPLSKRFKTTKSKWGDKVYIRIFKKERQLEIWIKAKTAHKFKLLKVYKICNYSGKLGPKLKEGDGQAPEGFYKVYKKSLNPHSSYHLSFNLGFPNRYDRAHKRTGSYLMVHGECASIGCYAMGNKNIEQIYKFVKSALFKKQPFIQVAIYPFRMSKENLLKHKSNRSHKYWINLKEGYDIFLKNKIPPKVYVKNKKYKFKKVQKQ